VARRQLHLGLFIYPGGHHIAGWRHSSVAPREVLGFEFYRRAAAAAERGKFDLFFVGDMLAAREKDGRVVAQGGFNFHHIGTGRRDRTPRVGRNAVDHL
jgi:alkanesulfonate monooxygenase SsuD/methylene tetrahydromethanopterin reductase-like flavin-dependent oxidoreductase (luciferase family)